MVSMRIMGSDSLDVSTCPDGMCASAGGVGMAWPTPGAEPEGSTKDVAPSASTAPRPTEGTVAEACASGIYNEKRIEMHQNEDGRMLACGTSLGIFAIIQEHFAFDPGCLSPQNKLAADVNQNMRSCVQSTHVVIPYQHQSIIDRHAQVHAKYLGLGLGGRLFQ